MSLSCSCPEWDGEPGTWAYLDWPDDFTTLATKRRKRCASCQALIDLGAQCLQFDRIRAPYTEIEERIKGGDIPIPPRFLCGRCGEIWLNLHAIGYCVSTSDNMEEALKEYHALTGFVPGHGPGGPGDTVATAPAQTLSTE